LQCRGLVFNYETGEVIGRPLNKFFNHNEPSAPVLGVSDEVVVMDKLDGSLITVFLFNGKIEVASSGSFHSLQAESARQMVANGVFDDTVIAPGYTYLFELVGPSNRIVLEYPKDELVYLGSVHLYTGQHYPSRVVPPGWTGPVAQTFEYATFGEALAAQPRKNAEGYVIKRSDGAMVKYKQEDYINLHRLVSNLSERSVWEAMVDGKNVDEIKQGLPEEFHGFVDDAYATIMTDSINIRTGLLETWRNIKHLRNDRRAFAMEATKTPYAKYLFMMLDDRSAEEINRCVLKTLKPRGN
jgi:RNA ligase